MSSNERSVNYATKMACMLLSSCEEQRSVGLVQFLWAKGHNPREIHRDMCDVYGEDCMDGLEVVHVFQGIATLKNAHHLQGNN